MKNQLSTIKPKLSKEAVLRAAGDRPYFTLQIHTTKPLHTQPAAPCEQSEGGVTASYLLYSKTIEISYVIGNLFN